tara:strand:+ start:11339 stop:11572 length:234 start_codon:yes stop_codon:yes gene_type:complete
MMSEVVHVAPKSDQTLYEALVAFHKPQCAYGECLKNIKPGDTIPRGKCRSFYKRHELGYLAYWRSKDFENIRVWSGE